MAKAAVLGYGNIGSGVVQVLLKNREAIAKKAGQEIIPACVLDLRDFPGDVMEDKVVRDITAITKDPEITVVVETMGGTKPAYEFVKACLLAGKHVATSNKELVAAHGEELLRIAEEAGVQFLFEASVGGTIPIIRALTNAVTADPVTEITGILNGTTNYMLTRMSNESLPYDEVLRQAQELGFAERNPAADVEGHDACRKIAILASVAFGHFVDYREVLTEGITGIGTEDILYARAMGRKIKLFGTSRRQEDGSVSAAVYPVLIGADHPLFGVDGVMNAVLVRGKNMGDLMFYGAGAGKLPTACAVVEDVISALRNPSGREIAPFEEGHQQLMDAGSVPHAYLLRLAREEVSTGLPVLEKVDVGISGETGIVTKRLQEKAFLDAIRDLPVKGYLRLAE